MTKLDFVKKGMIGTKYVSDGCEFKKIKDKFKLVSVENYKFQPFIGKTFSESIWDMISNSDVTSGEKFDKLYSLLLDHFKSGQTIFNSDANILLKKDEKVIYKTPGNVTLREPKSIRVTDSVHVGSGRRHGKRSFGIGTSKSVGESKEVVKDIDVGQIIITNKRFIYSGNKRNIDVNISQIIGITPYNDGFKLQRKSKQKPEYFINIDSLFFKYKFNNEDYFFTMNGQIIKAMLEGGLNKTPKTSKLQQISAQPKIGKKVEIIKVTSNEFSLEYNSNWKKIENKIDSHILTIERIDNGLRAEIHISKANIPENEEQFKNDIRKVMSQKDFEISRLENIEKNGIKGLFVSALKKGVDSNIEFDVTYLHNKNLQYAVYLTNNQLNTVAKSDYDAVVNSFTFVNSNIEEVVSKKSTLLMKYCPNCGTHVEHDGKFCGNCGFELR